MKRVILIIAFFFLFSALSRDNEASGDLRVAEYDKIENALTQGDERQLPSCLNRGCPADMRHLIDASALRIQWDLAGSLKEASRCEELSRINHDLTHFTCARLVAADASNLYGFYGEWATIDMVADAVKRAYAAHLWGVSGSWSSNPMIKEADQLKNLKLNKEDITYNSTTSIPLFGDGGVKSYALDGRHHLNITLAISYPSAHVRINGKDLVMLIDTGAQTTTLYASAARKVGLTTLGGAAAHWTGITGASHADQMGVAETLAFANLEVKHKYVQIQDSNLSLPIDGIIGFDLLDKVRSFMFTKDSLLIDPPMPQHCSDNFTISSNLYSTVNGIIASETKFNGRPAVALLDTGNAGSGIAPTWQLVKRYNLTVSNKRVSYAGAGSTLSALNSGDVKGALSYLGEEYFGAMAIGANFPNGLIDFDIGAPFFYGDNLYINFDSRKICLNKVRQR